VKYTNHQALEKHLKESSPESIYLVLVKDEYDRKKGVKTLLSYLEKGPSIEKKILQGDQLSIEDIGYSLNAIPMFSQKLLLVIHDADKQSKSVTKILEEYFLDPNPAIILVMDAASVTRSTRFYKNADKAGVVLDIPEEKPWEKERSISGRIQAMVKEEGKQIQPQACQELVKHLGTDQALVFQEIEKLVCYIGERPEITALDVSALCSSVNVQTGWQLGDAIFQKNAGESLRIARSIIEDGVPIFSLLRQIRSQFQSKLHICSILATGGSHADVQQKFPYMKGRILQNNVQLAQQYGLQRLQKGIILIDETEIKGKNSTLDHAFLVEHLIAKLTIL